MESVSETKMTQKRLIISDVEVFVCDEGMRMNMSL